MVECSRGGAVKANSGPAIMETKIRRIAGAPFATPMNYR